ncbi:hypothetical protein CAC42_5457 [Sphaceloma murrayae]|uniref:ASST-domain-containing protein n=1 Tax=Sphaceloma murrayae TaxID=2082308 RepID=A0A2K1QJG2_9PEZI|nr:hypothetical protein CAC42_5457 [Sphaceloma murrayae]
MTRLLFHVGIVFAIACCIKADVAPFNNSAEYGEGRWGNYTRQRFLSDEEVIAPVANILTPARYGTSPSKHLFWVPMGPGLPQAHPILLDTKTLSPVWYGSLNAKLGAATQSCNGSKYITFFSRTNKDVRKEGMFHFLNSHYESVYNVTAKGDLPYADPHELFLTPRCTAVFSAYKPASYDLSAFNISNGWLLDSHFQDVDLATQTLLFSWQASRHVDPKDSYWSPALRDEGRTKDSGWDWFHINSIEKDRHGNFLVSSRHMNALYYVSGATGDVIWTLGGKRNDFKDMSDGKATDFAWQHHARWADDDLTKIHLFDNRNTDFHRNDRPHSRGILLRLDFAKSQVWLEHEYLSRSLAAVREGSMQTLSDSPKPGNALVGYGSQPVWTEFDQNGTVLWDVALGPTQLNRESADNFRTFKFNWTGTPTWRPKIAFGPLPVYAFDRNESTFHIQLQDLSGSRLVNNTAYFSWNGATEIVQWVVLASNTTSELNLSHFWARVPKTGFEDNCFVGESTRFVTALAVDEHDEVLGQTHIVTTTDDGMVQEIKLLDDATDTQLLTVEWQKFLRSQSGMPLFKDLKDHWRSMARPHQQMAVGAGTILSFALIIGITVGIWAIRRRRRPSKSYSFSVLRRQDGQDRTGIPFIHAVGDHYTDFDGSETLHDSLQGRTAVSRESMNSTRPETEILWLHDYKAGS